MDLVEFRPAQVTQPDKVEYCSSKPHSAGQTCWTKILVDIKRYFETRYARLVIIRQHDDVLGHLPH